MSSSRNRALSIAAKVGLGAKELSKPCDDRLFSLLANFVHPWRLIFSPLLSEVDLDDVAEENQSRSEQKKRVAALRMWKKRKGHEATYDVLVKAVLDNGNVDQAEALCQLLALQLQSEQAPTESSSSRRSPSPPRPSPTPPLSSTTPATETLSPIATSLEENIKRLDEECTKIERLVLQTIKHRKVPHKTMLEWIQVLPMTLKSQFSELLQRNAKALSKASNVDELFIIISPYWNSLHPTLLSHLVENLADEKLKSRMKKYMDDLGEFRIHTRLEDLIEKWAGGVPPGFDEFALKFGEKWAEKTVEDFEQFRIRLSRQKCIGGHMTYMKKVTPGSIFVELALPQCCFPLTLDRDMEKFLMEEDVLGVYVDGLCILDLYQPELYQMKKVNMARINMSESTSITITDSVHDFMDLAQAFLVGQDLKILVCGKSGTGKSSLINTMLGQEVLETAGPGDPDFSFVARTDGVTSVSTHMQNVSVEISDIPALQDVTEVHIDDMYKRFEHSNMIIYCVDMRETRWFPEDIKETKLLTKKFGVNIWKKAVLVMTKANMVQRNKASDDEKAFCKRVYANFVRTFQQQLIEQGVNPHVARKIRAVAAGSTRDRYLPYVSQAISEGCNQGYQEFLPELWLMCFEQMSGKIRDTFLKVRDYSKSVEINKDRLPRAQMQLAEEAEQQFKEKEKTFKETEVQLNAQITLLQRKAA